MGVLVSWPYFWAKKTNKSQAPIQRRFMGLGYGLVWPVFVITALMRKKEERAAQKEHAELGQRILGDDD